jgi:hypothetical protein
MFLSASEAHPGEALTLSATGAAPGATVRFYYSVNGVGAGPRVTGYGNMAFHLVAPVIQFPAGTAGGACQTVGTPETTCTAAGGTGSVTTLSYSSRPFQTGQFCEVRCVASFLGICLWRENVCDPVYTYYQVASGSGSFASTDPFGGYRSRSYSDRYAVYLNAGQRYEMQAEASFDGFLYLYGGSSCGALASDDDSGGNRNPLIVYTPSVSGTYYLVPTTYDSEVTGSYTIRVIAR